MKEHFMKNKHLIVISLDAFVFEDLEYAKTLPNFAKLMKNCSIIERVKTIYPSVTHPVHATLITGAPAGVTGAVNNSIFNYENPDKGNGIWYNFINQMKVETIFHVAKRAGLTTASASWPMTSKGQDVIDYLVPCALNADFEGFENPLDAYRNLGAQECVMDIIAGAVERFGWQNKHPEIEEFQAYCCVEIIKRFKPNLLFTHPSYVDNQRHAGGVWGEKVNNAIRETDRWLGMMLDAVKEAGIEDTTDIIFLSDHGQINITRTISPNVYLADKGYIKLDSEGNIAEWEAFAKSTGASTHVYLSRPDDKKLYDEVYKLLSDMAEEGIYGFERVYTTEETKEKYNLYGDFSFVLETDGYTSFGEWVTRPAVRGFDPTDYRFGQGTHGQEPEKGPQPPFVATGPSFKSGVVIEKGEIINHAPTFAAVFGLEMPQALGTPVREIFK
jgi:predicted AlkP superfamily pyrophosphatase or phosphodiesterase